jgi:site-specific recombinase XerD
MPELIRNYAKECVRETGQFLSSNTTRSYKTAIDKFLLYLEATEQGSRSDEEFWLDCFIRFPLHLAEEDYPQNSRQTYAAGVKTFFAFLIRNRYIKPAVDEVERFYDAMRRANRKRTSRLPKSVGVDVIEKLIAAAQKQDMPSPIRERDLAIVRFLYHTGCRVDEMCRLEVGDFDFDEKRARIIGKGDKEAFIQFNKITAEVVQAYWSARRNKSSEVPAFGRHDRRAGKKGVRALTPGGVRYVIDKLAMQAGVDPTTVSPHKFRHAFATLALATTGRIEIVQELMRHSNIQTTRIYAKVSNDELRAAYDTIEGRRDP